MYIFNINYARISLLLIYIMVAKNKKKIYLFVTRLIGELITNIYI